MANNDDQDRKVMGSAPPGHQPLTRERMNELGSNAANWMSLLSDEELSTIDQEGKEFMKKYAHIYQQQPAPAQSEYQQQKQQDNEGPKQQGAGKGEPNAEQ